MLRLGVLLQLRQAYVYVGDRSHTLSSVDQPVGLLPGRQDRNPEIGIVSNAQPLHVQPG